MSFSKPSRKPGDRALPPSSFANMSPRAAGDLILHGRTRAAICPACGYIFTREDTQPHPMFHPAMRMVGCPECAHPFKLDAYGGDDG